MHVELTAKMHRRLGALAVVTALALVPSSALAAKPKPRPKPIVPSPYLPVPMSDVQIS